MIQQAFDVKVAVAAQLVTAFTLAYGIGSPVFVAMLPAQRQRMGLLGALALFVIANVASALVENFVSLMIWRAIAGVGAAAGGFILLLQMPGWILVVSAGVVSVIATLLQILPLRSSNKLASVIEREPPVSSRHLPL